ncbi:hypothetical protein ACWGI8_29595 [Streptomyces sp. NPDC054841]
MPTAGSPWRRAFAVVAALSVVLCGVLLGAGATSGHVQAPTSVADAPVSVADASTSVADAPRSTADAPRSATGAPRPTVVAVPAGDGQAPGCGRGSQDDGGLSPATPPRGSSSYELLPALQTAAHGAAGCWAVDEAVLAVAPERGPPPVAAPSPMDLSVLRV